MPEPGGGGEGGGTNTDTLPQGETGVVTRPRSPHEHTRADRDGDSSRLCPFLLVVLVVLQKGPPLRIIPYGMIRSTPVRRAPSSTHPCPHRLYPPPPPPPPTSRHCLFFFTGTTATTATAPPPDPGNLPCPLSSSLTLSVPPPWGGAPTPRRACRRRGRGASGPAARPWRRPSGRTARPRRRALTTPQRQRQR